MLNFLKSLQYIFRPSWWGMNNEYSPSWDKALNCAMDGNWKVVDKDIHTLKLTNPKNDNEWFYVWTSNYPYGYARPYKKDIGPYYVRPSRLTIEKLSKYIDEKTDWSGGKDA